MPAVDRVSLTVESRDRYGVRRRRNGSGADPNDFVAGANAFDAPAEAGATGLGDAFDYSDRTYCTRLCWSALLSALNAFREAAA
jgi:hypothetical protein